MQTHTRQPEPFGETFLHLLDDTTPSVRKALLTEFSKRPTEARTFLDSAARDKNRAIAGHARWFMKELRFTDPVEDFRTFIRSLHYELETGALLLAQTVNPDIDVAKCIEFLDELASRCRELATDPCSPREKCRIINRVLFHERGFHANLEHYADPLNCFIDQVLERRKGIPISLSILYILVARRLGLELEPVGLPGHFVVGCYAESAPFFVDAFDGGRFRTPMEIFEMLRARQHEPHISDLAPVPTSEVLCRCCRNLVTYYVASGDLETADMFNGFALEFSASRERHST